MFNVTTFAAVSTKIRYISGRQLKDKDYLWMLSAKDVQSVFEYLKAIPRFEGLFENVDKDHLSILTLEVLLKKDMLKQYEKIKCFFHDKEEKILMLLLKRYEVEDIKIILRALFLEKDINSWDFKFINSKIYSYLDYKQLLSANSLEGFIESLKGSPYYNVLKIYLSEDRKRQLFYMEMNLDRLYFTMLLETMKNLSKSEKGIYEALCINIDFLNFQWIYRGKKYYTLSSEELLNYTLPEGAYMDFEKLKILCYKKDPVDIYQWMENTPYRSVFKEGERHMEKNMHRYLFHYFKKINRQSQMNWINVITFIHEIEYEMKDLLTLIEGKSYDLSSEEIKTYLVRKL